MIVYGTKEQKETSTRSDIFSITVMWNLLEKSLCKVRRERITIFTLNKLILFSRSMNPKFYFKASFSRN